MATSGTIDRELASWLKMRIKWVVNSQSVANNTSNITVTAQLISGNGSLSIGSRDVVLTINGTKYTGSSSMSISANTTKNLFSKTVNVAHNDDGSKTVALACTLTFDATISGEWWGDRALSGSAKLNTIARKSTFTRSGTATMGYAQTIKITRQSSSFTHTLKYTWAGSTATIATGIGTSYTWTPPASMASKILNATSGSCKLTLETYNGSTLIGTTTLTFTLSVPAASTFTRSGTASIGSKQTITITRKSTAFTHTLKYTWAGSTATIATGITTSYEWTPPVSLVKKILNATSGSCKLTLQTYNGTALVGTTTLTFTLSVPTKSTFTRNGTASIGSKQTITITRKSDAYTHKLYYTWSGTKTLIDDDIATSYEWTPPVAMATKIPSATSGSCTLTLETYNGTALVGSNTLAVTLSVPTTAAYMPSISAFTLAEAVSGLAAQFGGFVNTKSKIKYTVTAAGAQGSTIKSYSVSLANQKFTSNTGTTAVISCGSGTKAATVTVTDSRGRTATKSVDYTVYAYTPPAFKGISVKRCNADGTESDDGTCMKFYVSVAVAAVNNKNTATYSLAYKLSSSSSYTALPLEASGYSYSGTTVFTSPTFSIENTYDIKFTATDYFVTTTSVVELPTASPMIDYKANHKGIGIGKVAQVDNLLDIGYSTRFYGGITPIILDSGTDFNTLFTPNLYIGATFLGDGTTANYMNSPSVLNVTFLLEVLPMRGNDRFMQRITLCYKGNSRKWERHYYSSSWGEWFCTYADANTVLASLGWVMNASQTATLSEPISKQPNGIVLLFSRYDDGTKDDNFNTFFISKKEVALKAGCGHTFTMFRSATNPFKEACVKYLYINDTNIVGHDYNSYAGTGECGITYNNKAFVLRSVIGV